MLRNEISGTIQKWVFWLMAAGIGVIKFISVFSCHPGTLQKMLAGEIFINEIVYYEQGQVWDSFASYAIPCLCVCAVAKGVAEDIECGRYNYMLPRSGTVRYAAVKVGGLCVSAFVCMTAGDLLYFGIMKILGFPLVIESFPYGDELLDSGLTALFMMVKVIDFGVFGVFISLLAMLISLWIRDWKFVMVLPAVLMYFFQEFLYFRGTVSLEYNKWIAPRAIYLTTSFWHSDVWQCVYSCIFTLVIAIVSAAILNGKIRRWRQ